MFALFKGLKRILKLLKQQNIKRSSRSFLISVKLIMLIMILNLYWLSHSKYLFNNIFNFTFILTCLFQRVKYILILEFIKPYAYVFIKKIRLVSLMNDSFLLDVEKNIFYFKFKAKIFHREERAAIKVYTLTESL